MEVAGAIVQVDEVSVPNENPLPFHQILDASTAGMALVGDDNRLNYTNKAFAGILGLAPQGCAGMPLTAFARRDGEVLTARRLNEMLNGGEFQCQFMRPDGSMHAVAVSAARLGTGNFNAPICLTARLDSVSTRDKRLQTALEAAEQGVWDHNNLTGVKYHSPTWRRMRGLKGDDPLPTTLETWLARIHPDDQASVVDYVRRQDAGELTQIAYEFRERHQDGRWLWMLSRGKPVEWQADGTPIRIIGTDTDITALKSIQAELAAEKERLKITLQSIGDGVISTDANGMVTFMNPIAQQMTGWSFAEAAGAPIATVFTTMDNATGEPLKNPVAHCLDERSTYKSSADMALIGRGGIRHDIRSTAAPVKSSQNDILGAVLVFQDFSESRALQRELAHAASHDGLTGLANRTSFESALEDAQEQVRNSIRQHAVCFIDIDRFKAVNDTAGHAAGDAMLREIARTIKRCCRQEDIAARLGGDEFTLLLRDCSPENAIKIGLVAAEAIGAIRLSWQGKTYQVGASVGVATLDRHSRSAAMVLIDADAACYSVKQNGGGDAILVGAAWS